MKVFLSSTGRDLRPHREAAFRALQGMDLHCVRMEDFHFAAVQIKEFDDQRIAACDVFVILLGQRYGTCPDGSEKSYTELEYETAVKLKKPCFLFLSDEDYALTTIREPDAQSLRLRALRQRAGGVIRNSFTTPEDLATRVVLAIHNWRATAEPNYADKRRTVIFIGHGGHSREWLVLNITSRGGNWRSRSSTRNHHKDIRLRHICKPFLIDRPSRSLS